MKYRRPCRVLPSVSVAGPRRKTSAGRGFCIGFATARETPGLRGRGFLRLFFPYPLHAVSRAGGDEAADDDVLLEALEAVHLARDCGIDEHLRGLLERRGGEEALRGERDLRDAEEQFVGLCGAGAPFLGGLVLLDELGPLDDLARQEFRFAGIAHERTGEHLADDDLD